MRERTKREQLAERWVSILRDKAQYEADVSRMGDPVVHPSIYDICNEIEAFFAGLEK